MRLIDADKATAVVGYFLEQMGITLFGRKGKDLARTLLLQVPTVDAVIVVRCRECKWYGGDGWESDESKRRHWCNRVSEWGKCIHVNADDFCSYGERKESE